MKERTQQREHDNPRLNNNSRLNPSRPNPDNEKKLSYIFVSTLLCGASKGFMKAFFIKPFEVS